MLSYEANSPHGGRLITCSLLLPTDFETDSVDISFPDVSGVPVRDFLVNLPDGIQKAKFNLPEVHFDVPRWNLDGALQGTLLYPSYACMTIWSDGTFYGACPSLNFMSFLFDDTGVDELAKRVNADVSIDASAFSSLLNSLQSQETLDPHWGSTLFKSACIPVYNEILVLVSGVFKVLLP